MVMVGRLLPLMGNGGREMLRLVAGAEGLEAAGFFFGAGVGFLADALGAGLAADLVLGDFLGTGFFATTFLGADLLGSGFLALEALAGLDFLDTF